MNLRQWVLAIIVGVLGASGAATPSVAQDRMFGGYDCTDDCSGHAAGYEWAKAHRITDASDCPTSGPKSFYEGCLVYTEDPDRGADWDDDGDPIQLAPIGNPPNRA
jgi:hypothetical protein